MKQPPPNWGQDALSRFLDLTRCNQFSTFHNKKSRYDEFSTIDGCFDKIAKNIINPSNPVSAVLLIRCHSAFRVACATRMAGQGAETFVLLRSCLEYAAYGFAIFAKPSLTTVWLNRHENDQSKKVSVSEFQINKIRKMIDKVDTRLTVVFGTLYDTAIDLGAHPNERAATSNMAISKKTGQTFITQDYLQGDGFFLEYGLKFTAQVGVCCLLLFQHAYPEKFMLLGVRDIINNLRRNL